MTGLQNSIALLPYITYPDIMWHNIDRHSISWLNIAWHSITSNNIAYLNISCIHMKRVGATGHALSYMIR